MTDLTEEERDALVNPDCEPDLATCRKAIFAIDALKDKVRQLESRQEWVAVYNYGSNTANTANTAKYRRVEAVLIHGKWLVSAADLPGFEGVEPR